MPIAITDLVVRFAESFTNRGSTKTKYLSASQPRRILTPVLGTTSIYKPINKVPTDRQLAPDKDFISTKENRRLCGSMPSARIFTTLRMFEDLGYLVTMALARPRDGHCYRVATDEKGMSSEGF